MRIKIFKFLFLISILAWWKPVFVSQANGDTIAPAVAIVDLPEYLNKRNFEISYTALDAGGSGLKQVMVAYRKEGGSWIELGTYNQEAQKVFVDSGKIDQDTKYYFKAVACDYSGNCSEDQTFTNIDTSAPPKPENYQKEKIGVQSYKIKWHNPSSDDLAKVYIYRSDQKEFDANDSTEVARLDVSKNTDSEWIDWVVPDSTKDYYYALRSVDKAGNGSDLVGDTYSVLVVEEVQGQPISEQEQMRGFQPEIGRQPEEGKEKISGGKILGEEAEKETTSSAETQEWSFEDQQTKESQESPFSKTNLPWLIGAMGVGVILIIAGFKLVKKS